MPGNPNPKPPKRRRSGISRHGRGKKQKISNYNMEEARANVGLPNSASFTQVLSRTLQSGPNPPPVRSPPKRVVKAKLKEKEAENEVLTRDLNVAQKDATVKDQQIKTLKDQLRDLSQHLKTEKKKSRDTIAKLLAQAELIMSDACGVEKEAAKKLSAAELELSKEKQKTAQQSKKKIASIELQLLREKEIAKQNVQAAELKVSMEKQRSKLQLQEERRKSAADLSSVKEKHAKQLQEQKADYQAMSDLSAEQHRKKIDRYKAQLHDVKQKMLSVSHQWEDRLDKLDAELAIANDRVVAQKSKYRNLMQQQRDQAKDFATQVQNYEESFLEENDDLRAKLKKALSDKRAAERQSRKDKLLAQSRLAKWHEERERRRTAEDYAAQEAKVAAALKLTVASYIARVESDQKTKRRMKKEWDDEAAARKRGGGRRWPIWVVQLICELLVCGTSPQAIGPSIKIMYETLYGEKTEEEPPSVNFIRQCRVVVEIMGETVTALKLGSADSWKQLWTDATTRRQIPFTALIIGLLGDEEDIDPVIVSSCIFMDDERLQRLIDVVKARYPDKVDLIPKPDSISIDKLGNDGVIMTDTCNGAQKLGRVLVDRIDGARDLDCMNHLRNVWIGGMEKSLSKYLNQKLRSSLDDIDSTLRVTTSISAVIRAIDKEFSLSANYPKGHGELFLEWIRENYPGVLLLHVERASGSRQDLCTEGCLAIYMNYEYYVEFLDEMLRKRDANEKASILQQNLFVILTSVEMLALSRLLSIIHLSISMPFRFLAGKSHQFAEHGWSAADMSRVIDTLHSKLNDIHKNPSLILNENFMMNIFQQYRNELPPFEEYWVSRTDGTSVVHYKRIRRRLFHPTKKADKQTTKLVVDELAEIATEALVRELLDEKKATYKYLSVSGSVYSAAQKDFDSRKSAL
eukprot:scaffold78775_cov36-Cyclotella_meneghiniana.AAC.2